jgi:integrase
MTAKRRTPRPAAPTLGDAFAGFLEASRRQVEAQELAPGTLYQRRCRLAKCPPSLLARPLVELRPVDVAPWIDRAGHAPTTRGVDWTVVRQAARWAVESGLVDGCPLATMRVRKPAPPRRRLMTEDETRRWLDQMPPHLRELAEVLRDSGCRPNEARRIEARHLDGEFAVLSEHKTSRKTGAERLIPLVGDWPARLARLAEARPTGPLFRNSKGGTWCPMNLCQAFARARKRAGLPDYVTAYPMRHRRITAWLMDGVPVATVAALAGHANASMTLTTYNHVVMMHDRLRATVRGLGA